jgi:hypothetical protein
VELDEILRPRSIFSVFSWPGPFFSAFWATPDFSLSKQEIPAFSSFLPRAFWWVTPELISGKQDSGSLIPSARVTGISILAPSVIWGASFELILSIFLQLTSMPPKARLALSLALPGEIRSWSEAEK